MLTRIKKLLTLKSMNIILTKQLIYLFSNILQYTIIFQPVTSMKFLGDEETVKKAMEAVANQGKAK